MRDFPAEIARLALIIAEFQCDVLYRGQQLALAEFLPLNKENWITCGNALRLDWLSVWLSPLVQTIARKSKSSLPQCATHVFALLRRVGPTGWIALLCRPRPLR